MTENQMTDKEIKKALECCAELNYIEWHKGMNICRHHCPYKANCYDKEKNINMIKDALDLVNRQQADKEQLEKDKEKLAISYANAVAKNLDIKENAIKKIANSFVKKLRERGIGIYPASYVIDIFEFENIIKEVLGEYE